MEIQKRTPFFVFSAYRAVLSLGLSAMLVLVCVFGPSVARYYFGESNSYRYESGALAVHYIDVGQGDCTAINLPDGRVILIDGGTALYSARVERYLKRRVLRGSNKIDFVINTHAHDDHFGGLTALLYAFDIGTVYRPYTLSGSALEPRDATGELVAKEKIRSDAADYADFITAAYSRAGAGKVLFISDEADDIVGAGFRLRFHVPSIERIDSFNKGVFDDENNISPIITLNYASQVFVFTGDAGIATETDFRLSPHGIDFAAAVSWLQVGHHGSGGSSSNAFLDTIGVDYAIISYSAKNKNFPNKDALARLRARVSDDSIYKTAENGNIAVRCSGDTVKVFLGFDNPADWSLLIVIIMVVLFALCFVNFNTKAP